MVEPFENHYLDKLAQIQVIINYPYSVAQMCTHEDALAYILGVSFIDDVMSWNCFKYQSFNRWTF